ncbi:glycosyltransferase [Alcanivorax hongdengensis A-11-3]|uniref:Glycosyltransferase n=1 Tax=Alcanivorax hongdengensis A-11-3 TaxID=1177179 RepID=L0WC07_9GAMM|nr:glycosyltransferase [Alcanivorax hongdengensis]EKF73275.1 glycosyltransferase [Alcanivorax hongdengensis A-11-3]
MKPTITLAVSTIGDKIDTALELLEPFRDEEGLELIVLAQKSPNRLKTQIDTIKSEKNIRLIPLDSVGLSKSRNAAIKAATGDYIWILDDDVSIEKHHIQIIKDALHDKPDHIHIGQIECSDCKGFYKDYSRSRKGRLGLLRISSIEILAPTRKIREYGVVFNESIGLGTSLPSGEENVFLLDCLNAGIPFNFINKTIIGHPCNIEERQPRHAWKNPAQLQSKGNIARHVGGFSGLALLALWGSRALIYTKSIKAIYSILKGYTSPPSRVSQDSP